MSITEPFEIRIGHDYEDTQGPFVARVTDIFRENPVKIACRWIEPSGRPSGEVQFTADEFRARFRPLVIKIEGLDAAAQAAAAQLDQRTPDQKEADARQVLALTMTAVRGQEGKSWTDDMLLRHLTAWIATDQGRLDAFRRDHPEAGR